MDQLQNQRAAEQYHRRQSSAGSGSSPGGGAVGSSLNTTVQTTKPDFQSIMKEHATPEAAEYTDQSLETEHPSTATLNQTLRGQELSPDVSASSSPQRTFSTAKKLEKPASPVQHPLRVYFAGNDAASPEEAATPSLVEPADDLRLTQSPTSFGQQRGSPGASEEYRLSEGTPSAQPRERQG